MHTHKSAQTGLTHTWKLYANDIDPRICPIHALLWLARLYGPNCTCLGPLFLNVNTAGGVMYDQPVIYDFCLFLASVWHLIVFFPRQVLLSVMHLPRTCRPWDIVGGTLWVTLFSSWGLPVLSQALRMDCSHACSMGWLVTGGGHYHVSVFPLPKRQPWASAGVW